MLYKQEKKIILIILCVYKLVYMNKSYSRHEETGLFRSSEVSNARSLHLGAIPLPWAFAGFLDGCNGQLQVLDASLLHPTLWIHELDLYKLSLLFKITSKSVSI